MTGRYDNKGWWFSFLGHSLLMVAALSTVPLAVLTLASLAVSRLMRRTTYDVFALAGGGLGALCGLPYAFVAGFGALFLIIPVVLIPAALGAAGALVYRRLAGLEPVPLPEPIFAIDRDALVPADARQRRRHRVVLQS